MEAAGSLWLKGNNNIYVWYKSRWFAKQFVLCASVLLRVIINMHLMRTALPLPFVHLESDKVKKTRNKKYIEEAAKL